MKKVHLRRAAREEIATAASWYRERDPAVATRFLSEIRNTLALIERFAQTGAPVPGVSDGSVRRLPVRTFPYHVVFVVLTSRISVLAVAHDRRRPGYWSS